MNFKRGEIVLARFPFSDKKSTKRRPAVVVSPGHSTDGDYLLAFITSRVSGDPCETEVLLPESDQHFKGTGLKTTSIVRADKIASINQSIITGAIGQLDVEILKELDSKLKIALGLIQ